MAWFEKIRGIVGNLFQFDNGDGPQLKNNAGVIEGRDSTDANMALLRGSGIPSSGSTLDDLPDLLDLRGRVVDVEFDFAGATPPVAGTNTDAFGFVHTTGGIYTAGDIVYDTGAALVVMPSDVATHLTSRSAVTGTISLIADGVYARQGATWTLKGDGTMNYAGVELAIMLDYDFNDSTVSSTTNVPDGAVVTRVTNSVQTAFNDVAATLQVDIDGTSDQLIMATTDSKLKSVNEYSVPQHTNITSGTTGPVKLTVTPGTATAGAGQVIVHYVSPRT
jgi:hypothetical protein